MTEQPQEPTIGLKDIYELLAANYVMQQRIYDVLLAKLQVTAPADAERLHQIHENMQTLAPDIRLG
jgi:hypothetical protein